MSCQLSTTCTNERRMTERAAMSKANWELRTKGWRLYEKLAAPVLVATSQAGMHSKREEAAMQAAAAPVLHYPRVAIQDCDKSPSTALALVADDGSAAAGLWITTSSRRVCITVEQTAHMAEMSITKHNQQPTGCGEPPPAAGKGRHCATCDEPGLLRAAVCDSCSNHSCTGMLIVTASLSLSVCAMRGSL